MKRRIAHQPPVAPVVETPKEDNGEEELHKLRFQSWKESFDCELSFRFWQIIEFASFLTDKDVPQNSQRNQDAEAGIPECTVNTTATGANTRELVFPGNTTANHLKSTNNPPAPPASKNNHPVGNPKQSKSRKPVKPAYTSPQTQSSRPPTNKKENENNQLSKQSLLEKMISEYNGESDKITASSSTGTQVWNNDSDLEKFLKMLAEKIKAKYNKELLATFEPVQTMFDIYINNSVLNAQAFNSTRRKQRAMITDLIGVRYNAAKGAFGYDWLVKSPADIEAEFFGNDNCEIAVTKAFGKEWEEFYKHLKKKQVDKVYMPVRQLKMYATLVNLFLDNEVCVPEEQLDSCCDTAYASARLRQSNSDDSDSELDTKSLEIVADIRNKFKAKNKKRLEAEKRIARKAMQHAVNKYCETMETKLETQGFDPHYVSKFHKKLFDIILHSFYNSSRGCFVFTSPWHGERSRIIQMLESEYKEFAQLNETNLKLEAAENEAVVHFFTTQFRRKLMEHFIMTDQWSKIEAEVLLKDFMKNTLKCVNRKSEKILALLKEQATEAIKKFEQSFTNPSVCNTDVTPAIPAPPVLYLSTKSLSQPSKQARPEIPTVQTPSVPKQETPTPSTSSSTAPPPSDSGIGIYFTKTRVHVAAVINYEFQSFSVPSTIILYEEIPDSKDLTYMDEPPSKDPISLETDAFLTQPDYLQTPHAYYYNGDTEHLLAEEVLAILFESLKSEARSLWKRDITSDLVVIALPTLVDSRCRQRLKSALQIAGFNQSLFVQPTTAIYLSYLKSVSHPTIGHHAIVISLGHLGMEVALLSCIGKDKVETKSTGCIQFFGRHLDSDESILGRIESVIKYVIRKGNMTRSEGISCCITLESDPPFKHVTTPKTIERLYGKFEKILKKVVSKVSDFYCNISQAILPGLVWMSEDRKTGPSLDFALYSELFPYEVELFRSKNSDGSSLRIVSEGQKCRDIEVKIPTSQLKYKQSNPTDCKLFFRSSSSCIRYREMDFLQPQKLIEKAPNAVIIIRVSKEGIIDTCIDFKSDLTQELRLMEWKRHTVEIPIFSLKQMEAKRKRVQFIIQISKDRTQCAPAPAAKRIKLEVP